MSGAEAEKHATNDDSEASGQEDKNLLETKDNAASSTNDNQAGSKQLTKNQKRKLKKKRRKKELKETQGDTKKRKKEKKDVVEFVYDPDAALPKDEEVHVASTEKKSPQVQSPSPSSPLSEPSSSAPQSVLTKDDPAYKFKDLVLKFRKPTLLDREEELKEFFKTILSIMKKEEKYFEDDQMRKMQQTELQIGKLFQMLEKKHVSKEVLRALSVIKRKLVMQEYNEALGEYFSLTIGKAPWPTALGSKNVLEDEEKRKTLQAIKRLMTFFQEKMAPKFIPDE
jgi:hypothetical protein